MQHDDGATGWQNRKRKPANALVIDAGPGVGSCPLAWAPSMPDNFGELKPVLVRRIQVFNSPAIRLLGQRQTVKAAWLDVVAGRPELRGECRS